MAFVFEYWLVDVVDEPVVDGDFFHNQCYQVVSLLSVAGENVVRILPMLHGDVDRLILECREGEKYLLVATEFVNVRRERREEIEQSPRTEMETERKRVLLLILDPSSDGYGSYMTCILTNFRF